MHEVSFQIRNVGVRIDSRFETYPMDYWTRAEDGKWEPDTLDFIDVLATCPSVCLVDVGAASGIVSLYAYARGLKVFAVEPSPLDFQALEANVAVNTDVSDGLRTMWAVVGDFDGEMSYTERSNPDLLAPITFRPDSQSLATQIPVVGIRSLLSEVTKWCSPRVVAVKMDIEGAEFRVLNTESLREMSANSVIMHLSVHPGSRHPHPKSAVARGLWRLKALLETLALVHRLKRFALVRATIDEGRSLSYACILRRLDGPEKTLVCEFR